MSCSTRAALSIGALLALAPRAAACASCGSGGDSPLVLYPNEAFKAYVGETHQTGLATIYADGVRGTDSGPESRDTTAVAAGAAFLTDYFATVTFPYVTSSRDGRSVAGPGDPQLEARWTAVPTTLLAQGRPQVQLLIGYRRALGRSVYDSQDANQLDVTSVGYDEGRTGVDVWWGGRAYKYGLATTVRWPRGRTIDGQPMVPGRAVRAVGTLGYDLTSQVKVVGGAVVDRRGQYRDGDQAVADSEELDHSTFATVDWQAGRRLEVRFTLARTAAFGQNKNTTQATAATMALTGVL